MEDVKWLGARLFTPDREELYPLSVSTVGLTVHKRTIRPEGYSAVQLFFCRSGHGRFRFYGIGDYTMRENDCLIVPKQVPHEYYATSEPDRLWGLGYIALAGRFDELLRHFGFSYLKVMPMRDSGAVWSVIRSIWESADPSHPGGRREASKQAYRLLAELREQYPPAADAGGGERANRSRSRQAVDQAKNMINEHYAEPMLISLVAKTLGFTHQHLNRLFKRESGMTLYQYLQHVRVEKSAMMLHNRRLTVRDIAEQIGMDTGNFIRLFARHYGTTPARWREQR